MSRILFLFLVVVALLGDTSTVHAQSTPPILDESVGTGPIAEVSPPEDCDVTPVRLEDFGVPSGTPRPQPTPEAVDETNLPGTPADSETVAAIAAVAWEYTACLNAGNLAGVAALMTDDALRDWILQEGPEEVEEAIARLLGTPTPTPADELLPLNVRGVRVLADGRVGAIIDWCIESNFVIFERVGDRWLLDDEIGVTVADGAGCIPSGAPTS